MLSGTQINALIGLPTECGNRLRRAMELTDPQTTQEDLEAALGLSQPYISQIVNGKVEKLPLPTARKFAAYFGCSVDVLFPAQEATTAR